MEPYSASLFDMPEPQNTQEHRRKKGKGTMHLPLSYIVIDIETTGLNPRRDAIIEIGGLAVRSGTIFDRFQSFVRPEPFKKLTPFITNLTGIRDEDVARAPKFADILPSLCNFIGGYTIVGHNINFDIDFLYDRIYKLTGEHLNNPWIDTRKLAKTLLPGLPHYGLEFLCQYFGIEGNHHRAVDDCELTERVLEKLYAIKEQKDRQG
jgi:DNA polymerase-3 subunit epsilon